MGKKQKVGCATCLTVNLDVDGINDEEELWDILSYAPNCNDAGWKCSNCDRVLGKSELFDRTFHAIKVDSLLSYLRYQKLLHIDDLRKIEDVKKYVLQHCVDADNHSQFHIISSVYRFFE